MPYNPRTGQQYNPLTDGPPGWPDTAASLSDFELEADQFRQSLLDVGLGRQVTPGGAITNTVAYGAGMPSPSDYRSALAAAGATWYDDSQPPPPPPPADPPSTNRLDYWNGQQPGWKVGDVVPSGYQNVTCPPGQQKILQPDNTWRCQVPPSQSPVLSTGNPEADVAIRFAGANPILLTPQSYTNTQTLDRLDLSGGDINRVINQANPCGYLPDGPLKTACQIAQGLYNAASGQADRGSNLGLTTGGVPQTTGACNQGYHWNDSLRTCVSDDITNMLPGGTPYTTSQGTPIGGNMGAVKPRQVGTVQRDDGRVTPLWRCPRGMVLGVDYNCYWKQLLPRQWRANPPSRRPLLSAHDGMILNKAKTLEKKLRKVTSKHVHKACSCKTNSGRKK